MRYEFRAECIGDVARFILAVEGRRGAIYGPNIHQLNGGPRVIFSFATHLAEDEIVAALESIPDSHLMVETLR